MEQEGHDVSTIQDEDVLRRMWQATEDFGRKKEIRAHMYKLREARLKEFYTTGEVLRDVQRSNSSPGLREQQQTLVKAEGPTHADSLADHSFLSLKTKEIRDSESPTREVQYKNSKNRGDDGQWTITSKTEKSDDGKTVTSSRRATTQGSRAIDGGQLSYAAANEHQASIFSDGGANNYTLSTGESSKTFAQQNIVTGDDNNFRTSKTTSSSSSSKVVTTSSSNTTGNIPEIKAITGKDQTDNSRQRISKHIAEDTSNKTAYSSQFEDYKTDSKKSKTTTQYSSEIPENIAGKISTAITKTTYTSGDIPEDLKKSIADGNTKVYTETKTLPDGSTVTTTRYETKGSKKWTTSSGSQQVVEQKTSTDNRNRQIEYVTKDDDINRTVITTKTKEIYDDDSRNLNRNDKSECVRIIKSEREVYNDEKVVKKTEDVREKVVQEGEQDIRDVVKVTKTITREEDYLQPDKNETRTITKTIRSNISETQPEISPAKPRPQEQPERSQEFEPSKSCKPEQSYKPSSPTDGQYSTTYRSEFTNKRISVDVSATHDAFARSLRSISPDRIGERPKSRGSIRTSNSSLRSSTSPEKHPQNSRTTPDRKPNYDRISPDQRKHNTSPASFEYSPERKSPERKYSRPDSITIMKNTIHTDTITKKKTNKKSPERSVQSFSPARTPSPTKPTSPTKIKVTKNQTSPSQGHSPTKTTEKTSPIRSPTKSTCEIITVNTDTITRKKKQPQGDNERESPVKIPSKIISDTVTTESITRKKKLPEDDDTKSCRSTIKNTTETTVNTDTITRKKKKSPIRDQPEEFLIDIVESKKKPTSRDLSPTSLASDIEFINHNSHIVTDLDEPCDIPDKRPTTLGIESVTVTTKTIQTSPVKESSRQKSSTKSPLKEKSSPVKEVPKKNSFKPSAPELDSPSERPPITFIVPDEPEPICQKPKDSKEKPPLKRTETYEERCRQMLGLTEADTIPKKEYVDMYAGLEPVEEPMITKKYVAPLGPDDTLIQKSIQKINERPEIPDYKQPEIIDEFIITERRDVAESVPQKSKERKSPEKQKPQRKQPADEQNKKSTPKASSPDNKSPQKKPEGQYTTEYVEEYCEQTTQENKQKNKQPTEKKDKKPSSKVPSPDRKPVQKKPTDLEPTEGEYITEYTDEYREVTNVQTARKPVEKPKSHDIAPVRGIPSSPIKKPEKKSPPKKEKPKDDHELSAYEVEIETTTERIISRNVPEKQNPNRSLPDNKSVEEYITEYCETDDFIKKEKYDTDITLEVNITKPQTQLPDIEFDIENENIQKTHIRTHRIDTTVTDRQTSPRRQPQKAVPSDTTECTFKKTESEEEAIKEPDSKKFSPDDKTPKKTQKSSTEDRKSPVKQLKDRKDSVNKITTTTKIITKKNSSTDLEPRSKEIPNKKSPSKEKSPERVRQRSPSPGQKLSTVTKKSSSVDFEIKRREDSLKKKSPSNKFPKEKSPERPRQRSPSPTNKTTTRKTIETDRNITQITRKTSNKDISIKKTPNKLISSTKIPLENPIRKPGQSPETPDKKSLKPAGKTSPKTGEFTGKHTITKTITLASRTEQKPQSQVTKTSPKTVTTIKTTKITQPAPVTVTTIRKSNNKSKKPKIDDSESSESEYEPETVGIISESTKINKKKVVTTANIKFSNVSDKPNVSMPAIKVNKNEVTEITSDTDTTDSVTQKSSKKDRLTHKCITTKSIILNNTEIDNLEFTIDLQRSTSSREPSPDKICPIPVSSEDEGSYPRYPDQVSEPDDILSRRKPAKIADIPLTEEQDVQNFNRITEVDSYEETSRKPSRKITDIDRVTDTDESLLSVTEKVSRFISTAEKLTDDEPKSKKPAPKVPRAELIVDENLEDDECLLSVSDKVTKFITTAEQVSTKQDRSKSPKPKEKTPVDVKIEENDECLLSVNQKVSHFIQAAETSKKIQSKEGPAPKVSRPEFTNIDDTLKTDECLLSVSDKVSKFLTSAEKLTTESKTSIKRENSPEKNIKRESSPEKITRTEIILKREPSPEKPKSDTKFRQSPTRRTPETITIRKSIEPSPPQPRPKSEPSKLEPSKVESIRQEPKTVNLKSSEAVRKAKAMFENISKVQEVPKQRDILTRPSIWEGRKKIEDTEDVKLTDIGVYKKKESEVKKQLTYPDDDCKRINTNLKDVTLKSTKLVLNENRLKSPEREPNYLKPKQTNVLKEEITIEKKVQRSRSPNPNGDIPGYMKPIPKVNPEERNKFIIETRYRETVSQEKEVKKSVEQSEEIHFTQKIKHYENGDIPHYMLPLQRNLSPERDTHCHKRFPKEEDLEIVETIIERSRTPEKDIPGYMRPLQRHTHSPERDEKKMVPVEDVLDEGPKAGKKFGVTLRRTDSGRMITTATSTTITERRRSSTPGQAGQPVIEEIQDLEVLEKMMDKVVGYEQRRRIRAQIRVVKKFISDNKISKRGHKQAPSPVRDIPAKSSPTCDAPQDRRSPIRDTRRSTTSPSKKPLEPRQKSPKSSPLESKSSYSTITSTTSQKTERISSTSSKNRSISPEQRKPSQTTTTSSMYKTDLKHVQPNAKVLQEDKPSWVTNRNLKKTAETVTTDKKVVSSLKKNEEKRSSSPQKEVKPIDCITSSYGIGPTDENGQPLFGIRALRKAAQDNSKVHVSGTVVTSQFYSENGQEPVGEVTVTKYSNNPQELNIDDEEINKTKGITSVSMTQKFGTRGAPTLTALVDKKKPITDKQQSEEDEILKTTSSKVSRRGSVKALSQKFIENAVEISRNERQTSYPKAGLILRTSSFKDTTQASREKSSSRESSPGYQNRSGKISLESITCESTSNTRHSDTTKTFLNSHTRVANAQEVITRMKNAEKEDHEGDTPEDKEARMLLNKFLGAQVLMSGMEPLMGTQSTTMTSTSSASSAQLVRKVQKTKTTTTSNKEASKPISLTKRFQTPITAEVLQDIWDEQTLRALLEQCTDYEERRAIRARLRQVMAEQEAVANIVASAVSDRDDSRSSNMQERTESTKKTFSEGPVTTTQVSTTRVVRSSSQVSKPISPFAKFRQLDKQNSLNTPPSSPRTPTGTGAPLFKFTDPALSHSASTVKDRLLHWCQMKTKEYQNIKLENFSTSWADGMGFCALIHHFLPEAFDYHALNPRQRRHNFTLAFKVADEQAGIAPLLDVDDMVAMRKPDWKCVFTYVQSIYRRFKDED